MAEEYGDGLARLGERPRLSDLAGVPAPRAGGGHAGVGAGADLLHRAGPWTRAAGAAEELRTHLGQVGPEFAAAHAGLAAGTRGLRVAAVLGTVRASWERRIATATTECESLAGSLRAVAQDQGETDAAIRAAFARAGGGR